MTESILKISTNISRLLGGKNLSEAALSREIGVPRATINRIVSGKTPDPRTSTLQAIAKYFNISVDQLTGEQPLTNYNAHNSIKDMQAIIPILEWDSCINWKDTIKRAEGSCATTRICADSSIASGVFAVKAAGDAMWPQFAQNTLLIIAPDKKPKNRDFIIVHIQETNELLFRQLVIDGKYRFAKAINTIFPNVQLAPADNILGVVIQTRNNHV